MGSGEFVQVNRHLLMDLIERNLWSEDIRTKLIAHNGSVQNIEEIPKDLKELYKTVWEIKQRAILDMCADRGIYIDQSQSTNIHMIDATTAKLSSMHFHGWKLGLKTGLYYLRTKAAVDAIKFTVDVEQVRRASTIATDVKVEDQASKEAELLKKRTSIDQGSPYECINCSG